MAKIPNIVWSRLARKTPENLALHPDANLLAAFAEQALLERERVAVTAHLAECADCREYLAVAFAAGEREMPAVSRRSAGTGWFRQWRWIAGSAAACCLVAVALQYYATPPAVVKSTHLESPSVSSKASEPQAVEVAQTRTETPAVSLAEVRRSKVERPPNAKPEAPVLLAAKKEVAREGSVPSSAAPPMPATSAPQQLSAESALAIRRLETPKADGVSSFVEQERAVAARSSVPRQAPPDSSARTSAPPPGLTSSTSGFIGGTLLHAAPRKKAVQKSLTPEFSPALWSINASPDTAGRSRGVVQRSTDAGQTWEVVPLSERVSFRAVAASGPDVWVGGSEGRLFHSADGGMNWVEINVDGENAKPEDDIVRIDVRGPGQVNVTVSSGEKWISSDAGMHWKRE